MGVVACRSVAVLSLSMYLGNLIPWLILLLLLVEGSTKQWKQKHRTLDCIGDGSIELEVANGGQERYRDDQTRSGRSAILADPEDAVTCPHWMIPIRNSTACKCGRDLGVVGCQNNTQKVKMLKCYCMTYSSDKTSLIVGACWYSCQLTQNTHSAYYTVPSNVSKVCDLFHRAGQLCGKCKDGFAPPVYSYNSSCVNCTDYSNNSAKYMAISLLPITVLFLVVVIFRISAASGLLNVFVIVCQIMSAPYALRHVAINKPNLELLSRIGLSLYGISNLDFFRLVYSPFCLHPRMTTLQALALDYAIAVYPLFLIFITYLLVEMHDHDVRIVVWLWKPFHSCFKRQWNIKGSLINAFATFILLSYVKFLYTSFAFLFPVKVFDIHGRALSQLYLYYDGTVEYFGTEHLPFAILALVALFVFNIFPLLLLVLYPCQCFQRCLNRYNIRCQVLHTFMDVFQGSYKDGTNGTRDCRWFAALYLMLRIILLVVYSSIPTKFAICPAILLVFVPVFLTAIFHPHKSPSHNAIDIFLLLTLISSGISIISIDLANNKAVRSQRTSLVLTIIFLCIPFLYFIAISFYKLFTRKGFVQKVRQKLCLLAPCNCQEVNLEEPWPDRIINAAEYEPLLSTESIGNQNELTDAMVNENIEHLTTY